jgi:methylated-DNA-[protein]-cysteine S-methyltransferase
LEEVCCNPIAETQSNSSYYYKIIDAPIGAVTLIANDRALVSLLWGKNSNVDKYQFEDQHPMLLKSEIQLREYFLNQRTTFDIPLEPAGTEFQKQVWRELLKIPYGETISYGEQARRLGRPTSARAVGAANGKNPIGILIPCHRVIGASGALTGFAGGIEMKKKLLMIEGREN